MKQITPYKTAGGGLRALAMLDPVDGGQLSFRGEPIAHNGVCAFRSRTIYLHQRAALWQQDVEAELRRPFSLGVHRRLPRRIPAPLTLRRCVLTSRVSRQQSYDCQR